jgi:membrane-associated phospholipid phosphatase
MKERTARLITGVVNPFAVTTVVIALLAFQDTPDAARGALWTVVALALSVGPVFVLVAIRVRRHQMEGMFNNPRRQRYLLYGAAVAIGVIGFLVLWLGHGPDLLRVTFVAGVAALAVFMAVNFYWKISLHTAFIAGTATILVIVDGWYGALALVLLPAVAWSRLALGQHSLAQVTAGALTACAVIVAVFAAAGHL